MKRKSFRYPVVITNVLALVIILGVIVVPYYSYFSPRFSAAPPGLPATASTVAATSTQSTPTVTSYVGGGGAYPVIRTTETTTTHTITSETSAVSTSTTSQSETTTLTATSSTTATQTKPVSVPEFPSTSGLSFILLLVAMLPVVFALRTLGSKSRKPENALSS